MNSWKFSKEERLSSDLLLIPHESWFVYNVTMLCEPCRFYISGVFFLDFFEVLLNQSVLYQ